MKTIAPLLAALLAAGCSESGPMFVGDGNVVDAAVDAGVIGSDSGLEPVDSGPGDAGERRVDAWIDARDAGADAGSDAGAPVVDAGFDAGPPPMVDAGPPPSVVQVAAGDSHTCALRDDGTVVCWGSPGAALGYGGSGNWPFPRDVSGLSDAVEIAAGGTHTCAVRSGGSVSCWGMNNHGQVGSGTVSMWHLTPNVVGGVTEAVQVVLGDEHSCALNDGLTVDMGQCWGRNQHGQLGSPGAGAREASPFWVDGFNDGVELSARGSRTCVRRPDHSIWCWGITGPFAREPVAGFGVAVGRAHTCTLRSGPPRVRPACWGDNAYGQTTTVTATWSSAGTKVVAGADHTCALFADTSVWCWGRNHLGQLGTGSMGAMDGMPRMVLTGAADVSAGTNHTCAVVSGGVQCWGDASGGRLGDGSMTGMMRSPVVAIP